MTQPYYEDDFVTLYNANAFEIMSRLQNEHVDAVITDPPYSERTHANAKSNRGKGHGNKTIDFQAFTDIDLMNAYEEMGRVTRSWVVSTIDYSFAARFDTEPPKGLVQKRIGVWVKTNPMPQISADRPAQGWEAISYMHRSDSSSAWNGGGNHGNYISPLASPTGHPTPKPLNMFTSFVERFTLPGQMILDPFAGGGTTLLAARNLSRKIIGVELSEEYCELAARRLSQQVFDFEEMGL